MKERKLSGNSSCFLIRDERLKKGWHLTPIYAFLKSEGFTGAKPDYSIEGIDWLYVNISSKVFAKGHSGIALAPIVGNHAITFEEFLLIYGIYKQYDGFSALCMTAAEQAVYESRCARCAPSPSEVQNDV